jgi:hypothetical protein
MALVSTTIVFLEEENLLTYDVEEEGWQERSCSGVCVLFTSNPVALAEWHPTLDCSSARDGGSFSRFVPDS